MTRVRRRDVIALIGGAAAWPLAAHAQQERVRRVAVMLSGVETDPEQQARARVLREGLEQLGWKEGRNIQFEYRWPGSDTALVRSLATEVVASAPDVIVCGTTPGVLALQRASSAIPIVFANIADPVGSGIVPSLAKPAGNATGFTALEYAMVGKWLDLLKEIGSGITRVALLGNPDIVFTRNFRRSFDAAAASFAVAPIAGDVRDASDVERVMEILAREPNTGLLVVPESTPSNHRARIIALAARHRIPAVYPFRFYAYDGGLASYGPNLIEQYRRAAGYVDRILKGAKPADLPVQAPDKFELIINLKTAKALGLEVPAALLVRADEVIE